MDDDRSGTYGEAVTWSPEVPRLRPLRLLLASLPSGPRVLSFAPYARTSARSDR